MPMTHDQEVQYRIQQLAVKLELENDSEPQEALGKLASTREAIGVLEDWYESQAA